MGVGESNGSLEADQGVTDLYLGQVRAQNSGRCVEPRHSGLSLHLGAGQCTWPDWVNLDADRGTDIRALAYADDSVDRIAAIHVLEHFYEWEAKPLLKEWQRVLAPGGQLILELPCMDKVLDYMRRCLNESVPVNLAFSWWAFWGDPKHRDPLMTHKWGYTIHSLMTLLDAVGFVDIQTERPKYHFAERDMRAVCRKGEDDGRATGRRVFEA